jgi:hypothetical protein
MEVLMATRIPPDQIQNLQNLEAVVAGPDGANRLFTLTGHFDVAFTVVEVQGGTLRQNETFTVLLGPVLGKREFISAIGSAWLTKMSVNTADTSTIGWGIAEVDADFDDESKQVALRVEVFASSSHANLSIGGIGFHVTILAESKV